MYIKVIALYAIGSYTPLDLRNERLLKKYIQLLLPTYMPFSCAVGIILLHFVQDIIIGINIIVIIIIIITIIILSLSSLLLVLHFLVVIISFAVSVLISNSF